MKMQILFTFKTVVPLADFDLYGAYIIELEYDMVLSWQIKGKMKG